jgi:hypothetical protein
VTQTRDPYTIRLSFLTVDEPRKQNEAVCYLHITDAGKIDVYYSHEMIRVRAMDTGPWEQETAMRMPMSKTLEVQILLGSLRAHCDHAFSGGVKWMSVPPGVDPTELGRFIP